MLDRTLEPEAMDSPEEARDYDTMDHQAVNKSFVDDFLAVMERHEMGVAIESADRPLRVLDCGTGTAQIPIVLACRPVRVKVTAVDLSQEMLDTARRNVEAAGLIASIELQRADCKRLPFADAAFDAVISNSIVHHLAEPAPALAEMVRVLRPGGVLFVRDLLRPASSRQVDALVSKHAVGSTARQQQLFRDSLHAALRLEEIRRTLAALGLPELLVEQSSDRHWTVAGVPGRKG